MVGLLLSVLTAISWAVGDIFRKRLADSCPLEQVSVWLVLGQVPLMLLWALSTDSRDVSWFSQSYLEYAVACAVLNTMALLMMLQSLQLSPISLTIPLLSLTPLFSAIFDFVISNEQLTNLQWCGLSIVTLGATALGLGRNGWFREKGAWMMIGVAVVFSILFPLDRVGASMVGAGVHAFVEQSLTAIILVFYLLMRRRSHYLRLPKVGLGLIFGTVCTMTVAIGVQLLAYELGTPVSIVEVIKRSVGIFSAIGLGAWLFKEQISMSKLSSAAVMTIGIAVLLLA